MSVSATIRASGLFDDDWYVEQYADVMRTGLSPIDHYITVGASLLRDPGPRFSTGGYLAANPDVARAGVNPLWHYVVHGVKEGRRGALDPARTEPSSGVAVPRLDAPPPHRRSARVVAFYLPQFHPIPENDAWWGEGFTEWTNVRAATPYYRGHYQPHVPRDGGYYDLRDRRAQQRQVELARLYGIEAFCFYVYWFNGRRLLEEPVRNYLEDARLDLPFMICWANENWTRRWDGLDSEVLIAQDHSAADDLAFIEHFSEYLRDPRYERIGGKPVLLVYRPGLLPDPRATAMRWRTWCRENGIGEIYLAYTQSFESVDPAEYGFDGAVEFPPNNAALPDITARVPHFPRFRGRAHDWNALVDRSSQHTAPPYRVFRGVCPSWDNTPRRGEAGTVFAGSTPARFTRWLVDAIRDTRRRSTSHDDRFVFVNAWNEWGEGAHLEPDERHGYAWLESVRVALALTCEHPNPPVCARTALIVDCTRLASMNRVGNLLRGLPSADGTWLVCRSDQVFAAEEAVQSAGLDASVVVDRHGVGLDAVLRIVRALEPRDFALVLRLDLASIRANGEEIDPAELDRLRRRILSGAAELVQLSSAERTVSELAPWIERVGARLGLDRSEVQEHGYRVAGSFLATTRALGPLASLAFADDDLSIGGGAFPYMHDVLDAAVLLSASAIDPGPPQ